MVRSEWPPGRRPARHGSPSTNLAIPAIALAIGAHPDDIEFGCAATLAKWAVPVAGCITWC